MLLLNLFVYKKITTKKLFSSHDVVTCKAFFLHFLMSNAILLIRRSNIRREENLQSTRNRNQKKHIWRRTSKAFSTLLLFHVLFYLYKMINLASGKKIFQVRGSVQTPKELFGSWFMEVFGGDGFGWHIFIFQIRRFT